jgi:hypothetical protein
VISKAASGGAVPFAVAVALATAAAASAAPTLTLYEEGMAVAQGTKLVLESPFPECRAQQHGEGQSWRFPGTLAVNGAKTDTISVEAEDSIGCWAYPTLYPAGGYGASVREILMSSKGRATVFGSMTITKEGPFAYGECVWKSKGKKFRGELKLPGPAAFTVSAGTGKFQRHEGFGTCHEHPAPPPQMSFEVEIRSANTGKLLEARSG